ncbi:hypothetical protein GWK91_08605 [Virgibacillus sp. MSP4-1]|uniref:hypothetical protein n=1 Tax=Virgibacillus sp. MSP4-1 TaxID=2700081 RepID=UPI0003A06FA6|nr:hypothetical protein [Virgibacillus sp. MSP4-1]QHS23005.1 hypothetical protein GWK91_08605 [Virgibacillus sp. MSP4-1]
MLVLSRKKLVEEKTNQLLNGYSAYSDNDELIRLLKRNISRHNLDVFCDRTDIGCWFIPKHHDELV